MNIEVINAKKAFSYDSGAIDNNRGKISHHFLINNVGFQIIIKMRE